jgi:hypothetical protein
MCLDSLAPLGEFCSLRDFGRKALRSEGPSFWVRWSDDGQTLFFAEHRLQLSQFRQFAHSILETATTRCSRLMFDWLPAADFRNIKDDFRNTLCGYSFVQDPSNYLSDAYLQLLNRASTTEKQPLIHEGQWVQSAVLQYLTERDALLHDIVLLLLVWGGQDPRLTELLSLLVSNSSTSSRGMYVYNGYIIFVIFDHKARRRTYKEFPVARYLVFRAGRILYYYLAYIRAFSGMLLRQCFQVTESSDLLFVSDPVVSGRPSYRPWTSRDLTLALQQSSSPILQFPCGGRLYRQLSIAMTEKHVKPSAQPANRNSVRNISADIDTVFAWQSGHQVEERSRTYGLDSAYHETLQPALLRLYEWASGQWHRFLEGPNHTTSGSVNQNTGLRAYPSRMSQIFTFPSKVASHEATNSRTNQPGAFIPSHPTGAPPKSTKYHPTFECRLRQFYLYRRYR